MNTRHDGTTTRTARGSSVLRAWDEHIAAGPEDAPRYAHARATFTYSGAIEGNSTCDYLLYYAGQGHDGDGQSAPGLEFVEGTVDGRNGTFVLRHDVTYGPHGIEDTFTVVPGSGSGELEGLTGHGRAASATETVPYTFDYRLTG
ncbi:DUF3224 domain-containing protein [Saccharomonospora saliphila]|uniref:DUF3224 domain-containing protein n=1 Tax=Saccharomonospora saliphila TaxID=369829 RepID=UPI0006628A73|nr:DUF3224 domain-containing protein [Saccharomonospora saliphila]